MIPENVIHKIEAIVGPNHTDQAQAPEAGGLPLVGSADSGEN
jgi:hypothetical protein